MILQIVVMYDKTAGVYGQPQFVVNVGSAVRSFGDEIKREDANNILYKHPADFEMYKVGTYDDTDCSFNINATGERIARGEDFV